MKLIFVKEEFYLLSQEDFNEGDYYCTFSLGIKGFGRGWSAPRKHENTNLDKLNKCIHVNHKGKVVASSVKIGDLPLINVGQIKSGENFGNFITKIPVDIEKLALKKYPILINDPHNPMEDGNKDYRDIWIKGYKASLSDNYENKWTDLDIRAVFEIGKTTHFEIVNKFNTIEGGEDALQRIIYQKKENEWMVKVELNEFGNLVTKEGYINIIKIQK